MATNKNEIIKIELNLAELAVAKEGGKSFLMNPKAEEYILKIIEAQEILDKMMDEVKAVLGNLMDKQDMLKVDGNQVYALKQFFGARFEMTDPEKAEAQGFAETSKSYKLDSKAVEKYAKEHEGKMPEGVALRDRVATVSIRSRKTK